MLARATTFGVMWSSRHKWNDDTKGERWVEVSFDESAPRENASGSESGSESGGVVCPDTKSRGGENTSNSDVFLPALDVAWTLGVFFSVIEFAHHVRTEHAC